jgi:hypothetical protein
MPGTLKKLNKLSLTLGLQIVNAQPSGVCAVFYEIFDCFAVWQNALDSIASGWLLSHDTVAERMLARNIQKMVAKC